MTTKCTGIMGRIFGHKLKKYAVLDRVGDFPLPMMSDEEILELCQISHEDRKYIYFEVRCQRCGAVTGERK